MSERAYRSSTAKSKLDDDAASIPNSEQDQHALRAAPPQAADGRQAQCTHVDDSDLGRPAHGVTRGAEGERSVRPRRWKVTESGKGKQPHQHPGQHSGAGRVGHGSVTEAYMVGIVMLVGVVKRKEERELEAGEGNLGPNELLTSTPPRFGK